MSEQDYVKRSEFSQLDKRVGETEKKVAQNDTKITYIEGKLDDIKKNTNKILWFIVGFIVIAVLKILFDIDASGLF